MNKKRFLFEFIFCLNILFVHAQLSQNAKVSILTCGAGEEFYEAFGHSAIRILDDSIGFDYVFNYGVFNFNTDNFYLKFAKGQLPYELGVEPTMDFLAAYAYEQRSVEEQILLMNPNEINRLYKLLYENYLPENRYYAYDFFRDNCATRVRDILQKSTDEQIFNISTENHPMTYRKLYYLYTDSLLWWRLGIDIALGARTDKKLSTWDYMYLPNDLRNQLDTMQLNRNHHGFIAKKQLLFTQKLLPPQKATITPNIFFWTLFLFSSILIIIDFIQNKYYSKWFDILLFICLTILSALVIFLWFFSDHYATKDNFNLLWANPLAFIILLRLQKTPQWILWIFIICLIFAFGCFGLFPQQFNVAIIPILLILLSRTFALLFQKKQIKKWLIF